MSIVNDPENRFIFTHFNDTFMLSDYDTGKVLFILESKKKLEFKEIEGVYTIIDETGLVLWEEKTQKITNYRFIIILSIISWAVIGLCAFFLYKYFHTF